MKKINKKSDLPTWFNITDYFKLSSLSDEYLFYQLYTRLNAFMVDEYKNTDFFGKHVCDGMYVFNFCSHFGIDDILPKKAESIISTEKSISPLSLRDIVKINKELDDEMGGDWKSILRDDFSDNHIYISQILKCLLWWDGVYCVLNLNYSDEKIMQDIKTLLPKWREELQFKYKKSPIKTSWSVIKQKIFLYNAIAIFDLKMWEIATNCKISNGVLAVTLFPDGEYDSIHIAQTIKPFVENLFTTSSIEKIELEISNK